LNPVSAAASAAEILNGFVLAKTPEFVLTQGFMQLEDGRRRIAASSGCISRSISFIDRNKKAPGRSGLWAQFDITISPIADPQSKVKQNVNRLRLFPAMTRGA